MQPPKTLEQYKWRVGNLTRMIDEGKSIQTVVHMMLYGSRTKGPQAALLCGLLCAALVERGRADFAEALLQTLYRETLE